MKDFFKKKKTFFSSEPLYKFSTPILFVDTTSKITLTNRFHSNS